MKKIKVSFPPYFVEVRLYLTVKELQRVVKNKTCAGMYRPNGVVVWPKRKVYPKLGTIYLAKEKLGVGYISHEVFHCSMDYASKKFNVGSIRTENNERQEDIAYFHGHIVKEICNWLNDNKLW